VSTGTDGVLFLAWTRTAGRSHEIAAALGGTAHPVFPERLSAKRLVLLRYAYSLVASVGMLIRLRPSTVIVTNPPIVPGLLVRAWATLTRRPYVLDSHPSAFGAKNHRISQRLIGVHRWLARGAAVTMVTTAEWVDTLHRWGAKGLIVHEAPPLWTAGPPHQPPAGSRPRVLFPGVFSGDEPVDLVWEVARVRPEVEFRVTGLKSRCPQRLLRDKPDNITLVGYLDAAAYAAEVDGSHAILALTTEPTSVMRCGYEAVYSRRPLIVSGWPAGRDAFPHAVHTSNDAGHLASAVDLVLSPAWRDTALLDLALKEQTYRWNQQLDALRSATSATSSGMPAAGPRRPAGKASPGYLACRGGPPGQAARRHPAALVRRDTVAAHRARDLVRGGLPDAGEVLGRGRARGACGD
jgi:hypothetical protein